MDFSSLNSKNLDNAIENCMTNCSTENCWEVQRIGLDCQNSYCSPLLHSWDPALTDKMGFLSKEMRIRDYATDKQKESPRSIYYKTAPYWYLIIRSSYIREKDVQETSSLENTVLRYITEPFQTAVILPSSYTSWTFITQNSNIEHWR